MKSELKMGRLGSNRTLLLVGLMIMFMAVMPFASAFGEQATSNNDVRSYGYPEVQIKSWFGLGSTVESLNLNYHTPQCLINCESQELITLANDGQIIDNIRFIDGQGNDASPNSYTVQYGYLENVTTDVPEYSNVCNPYTDVNGTNVDNCTEIQTGSHQVVTQILKWQPYNYESVPAGDYLLKINAQKDPSQQIDWQVHLPLGGWITQHAWWNASWTYKEQINITEKSGNTLQSYPAKINLTWNSHMMTNFSDVRFVNSTEDGQLLVDNISVVTGTNLIATVNVSLTANANTTIWVYYGNSQATSSWNKDAELYDNFGGATLNNAKFYFSHNCTDAGSQNWAAFAGKINSSCTMSTKNWDFGLFMQNFSYYNWDNSTIQWSLKESIGADINRLHAVGYALANVSVPSSGQFTFLLNKNTTTSYTGNDTWMDNVTNVTILLNSVNNGSFADAKNLSYAPVITARGGGNFNAQMEIYGVWAYDYLNPAPFVTFGTEQNVNNPTISVNAPPNNYVTSSSNVSFNCSGNSVIGLLNLTLILDGVNNVTVTNSSANQNLTLFSNINVTNGAHNYTCSGANSIASLTVSPVTFFNVTNVWGLCNSTMNVPYVNFTFADERTLAVLNATMDNSAFTFFSTDRTASQSQAITYINNTHTPSYAFCGNPPFASFFVNETMFYSSNQGVTYPQRGYIANTTYTNTTTNVTLYLLSSANGQFVSFEVVSPSLSALTGVDVSAVETISGNPVTIDHKTTDSSGLATLWLSPTTTYAITFIKAGYLTQTLNIAPAQTSYTVIMGTTSSSNATDYSAGLNYSINPINTYLNNDTNYTFNFSVASPTYLITSFGYGMFDGVGNLLTTNTSTANGGTLSSNLSTGTNTTFIMNSWWIMNGTDGKPVNFNVTKIWVITNTANTQWSISHFLTDFNNYTASSNGGFFGLTPNGEALLIFLIIFISAGSLTYGFGIYSPGAVAILIAAETAFFDVALNLIPSPTIVNPVAHFATVVMGIIAAIIAIKEGTSF